MSSILFGIVALLILSILNYVLKPRPMNAPAQSAGV